MKIVDKVIVFYQPIKNERYKVNELYLYGHTHNFANRNIV
jgi:hypothetical protein